MPESWRGAGRHYRQLLFVYGTLGTGTGYAQARHLKRRCLIDLGPAWIAGRLYHLGRYPAAIPTDDAQERVYGRLCALTRPRECLRRLDAYEDYQPRRRAPSQFRRDRVAAYRLPEGQPVNCWVYYYNGKLAGRPRIVSGRYCAT